MVIIIYTPLSLDTHEAIDLLKSLAQRTPPCHPNIYHLAHNNGRLGYLGKTPQTDEADFDHYTRCDEFSRKHRHLIPQPCNFIFHGRCAVVNIFEPLTLFIELADDALFLLHRLGMVEIFHD